MSAYKPAYQRVPEALALPSRWLTGYGDFITKNASAVSQIESALRSLTYIIPGNLRTNNTCAGKSLTSYCRPISRF